MGDLVFAAKKAVQRAAEPLDPTRLLLRARARKLPPAPATAVCVYRRKNAARVAATLAPRPGLAVRLWALDEVAPELAALTVGSGPGGRFALLNRLVAHAPLGADDWLLLVDDDVELPRAALADVVAAARLLGLDLTQPSHGQGSSFTWDHTRHRVLSWGRQHRFVEIGPLVAMSPKARAELLPLPEDTAMGWGTEAVWAAHTDLAMGSLDAVVMRHVGTVGAAYDTGEEQQQYDAAVAALGGIGELTRERARWRTWQRARPW